VTRRKGRPGQIRDHNKHGGGRAINVARNLGAEPGYCSVCEWQPARVKGLCDTCYTYRRRTGHDRSEELILAHGREWFEKHRIVREHRPDSDVTLYRLFSLDLRLLYVGITTQGMVRLYQHALAQPWWPEVAIARFEHFTDRRVASIAEMRAIQTERPVYNKAHAAVRTKSPNPRDGYEALARAILDENFGHRPKSS